MMINDAKEDLIRAAQMLAELHGENTLQACTINTARHKVEAVEKCLPRLAELTEEDPTTEDPMMRATRRGYALSLVETLGEVLDALRDIRVGEAFGKVYDARLRIMEFMRQ